MVLMDEARRQTLESLKARVAALEGEDCPPARERNESRGFSRHTVASTAREEAGFQPAWEEIPPFELSCVPEPSGMPEPSGVPSESPASRADKPEGKDPRSSGDAFRDIVRLCGYHDFCSDGMRKRLAREGFANEAAQEAVGEAVRIGLIDDLRWGEMRIAALMRKGVGVVRIERDLADSGIDIGRIRDWPEAFQERFGSEYERASEQLRKSPPHAKNLRAAAYGKLIRKGYTPAVAHRVSGEWYENHCDA